MYEGNSISVCLHLIFVMENREERERGKLIQKLRETQRRKKGKEEPKKLGSEDVVSGEGRLVTRVGTQNARGS